MYRYMVIYQKNNGELLYRTLTSLPHYKKGQKTSMGWLVIDIQYMNNGKCYTTIDYDKKCSRRRKLNDYLQTINYQLLLNIVKSGMLLWVVYYVFCKIK